MSNDRFRGQGSYEKAHATLLQAMEAGIRVNLTCTFTDEDYISRGEYIQRFIEREDGNHHLLVHFGSFLLCKMGGQPAGRPEHLPNIGGAAVNLPVLLGGVPA